MNLRRLVERTTVLLRHRFTSACVRFEARLPDPIPDLHTDEDLLQQILVNLLINAIDASPTGSTVILTVEEEGERVRFHVVDCGPGIPSDLQAQLFHPFVTTKEDAGGTGLGLAMVKTLVGDLGGEVTFTSTPGRGTRFTVTLPLSDDDLSATIANRQFEEKASVA